MSTEEKQSLKTPSLNHSCQEQSIHIVERKGSNGPFPMLIPLANALQQRNQLLYENCNLEFVRLMISVELHDCLFQNISSFPDYQMLPTTSHAGHS